MVKTLLPPGFRFHPTDVELVKYYLKRKVMGKRLRSNPISEVDINKFAPWDLPDMSCLQNGDLNWYFFSPRERKYASGARMKRGTEFGYWKTTGKDRIVPYNNKTAGMIKTLVFHRGKAPHGDRTDWVMHEYRLEDKDLVDRGIVQDAYVLCKIFQKEGPGPRNGAQYGRPFKEEDWSDEEEVDCMEAAPSACLTKPSSALPINQTSSITTGSCIMAGTGSTSQAGPSENSPLAEEALPLPPNNDIPTLDVPQVPGDDELLSMLAFFKEDDSTLSPVENVNNGEHDQQNPNNLNHENNVKAAACIDADDIYNNLGDLGNCSQLSANEFDFDKAGSILDQMFSGKDKLFLELIDLDSPTELP